MIALYHPRRDGYELTIRQPSQAEELINKMCSGDSLHKLQSDDPVREVLEQRASGLYKEVP